MTRPSSSFETRPCMSRNNLVPVAINDSELANFGERTLTSFTEFGEGVLMTAPKLTTGNIIAVGAARFRCLEGLFMLSFIFGEASAIPTLLSGASRSATLIFARIVRQRRVAWWHDHLPKRTCSGHESSFPRSRVEHIRARSPVVTTTSRTRDVQDAFRRRSQLVYQITALCAGRGFELVRSTTSQATRHLHPAHRRGAWHSTAACGGGEKWKSLRGALRC